MREIKFRVWNKEKKRFEDGQSAISLNGEILWYSHNGFKFNNDFIVCQFTGLKDKNGVEIYEGDIIKGDFPINTWENGKIIDIFSREGLIAKIEYGLGGYVLDFINLKKPDWIDRSSSSLMRFVYAACYFEVIGNIYENSELLEENFNEPISK